jgi:GNAT superfamily N-acetyltransferase
MKFQLDSPASLNVTDLEIGELLKKVYVGEGFTSADRAEVIFAPSAVRGRGRLICARAQGNEALAGMVIVVTPDSPAKRIAGPDETELHLLAVDQAYRGMGLGLALVGAAIDAAKELGFNKMALWTQPVMTSAQKLYGCMGFIRAPHRDPTINGSRFLAYETQWSSESGVE